ncbi:MAG: type I secretion system permease/ATPase [Rhizobiaceae bacterium]
MKNPVENPINVVLSQSKKAIWGVALFSCVVNLLMLTGPMFMLQVYDRVLTSRSVPTLVALFVLIVVLFSFLGLFDFLRTRILSRVGTKLDIDIMALANKAWIYVGLAAAQRKYRPISDLTVIRQFIGSPGPLSLFDLPWVPFYLAIVYMLHFQLGLLATASAIVVVILTIVNDLYTKKLIAESSQAEFQDHDFSELSNRNAEAIVAMGMIKNITNHWQTIRKRGLVAGQKASSWTDAISVATKTIRMLLQSSMLALGAYLAIFQEITPGTMIAASILSGRALAPIDMAVGSWKNFIRARHAFSRLKESLAHLGIQPDTVQLPDPKGHLSLVNVIKMSPNQDGSGINKPILQGITLNLQPGDGLGVIGTSGSGKSSLARLIVGLWNADRGEIRLDGATYDQWDRDVLGKHIGYLPQSVELLPGTIMQNIARFDPEVTDEEVIAAAKLAGVHDLVLNLPNGYSTEIRPGKSVVSGGQAQRIALARAAVRMPALVVLDEPNSNLDAEGDAALTAGIRALRSSGSVVIVMAHRPSAIAAVNKILMLKDGKQMEFGEKDEVMRKVTRPPEGAGRIPHVPVVDRREPSRETPGEAPKEVPRKETPRKEAPREEVARRLADGWK